MQVKGILITLKTKNQANADTDDRIYIGVAGSKGGREFALDVKNFNDFEKGSEVKYWFGDVWEGNALNGAKRAVESSPGKKNDPAIFPIGLSEVNQVYIKKQGTVKGNTDDAWKMDRVEVTLYGADDQKRKFIVENDLWLGNEYGLTAWIPESAKL